MVFKKKKNMGSEKKERFSLKQSRGSELCKSRKKMQTKQTKPYKQSMQKINSDSHPWKKKLP